MYRTLLLTLGFFCLFSCSNPQPLTFNEQGQARGTGTKIYRYDSGEVMLREHYNDGRCVLSQWYTPGGQLIQDTHWINGTGEGIYLRQDGTVRIRMSYVNELAEGPAVYYDENGNVVKRVVFRDGQPIDD